MMKAAACGGDQRGLDGELEEKLLLHDGGLARCSAGAAAALQQKRGIERRRLPPVPAGPGGADDAGDYHERFVRAYDRLRDELLADDTCELTDEARRWVEQVRGRRRRRENTYCFSNGASYTYSFFESLVYIYIFF